MDHWNLYLNCYIRTLTCFDVSGVKNLQDLSRVGKLKQMIDYCILKTKVALK